MRVTQLRQADLNLLVVFSVLAEERNVSRAAKRLLLSQPAVSRALQRMRPLVYPFNLTTDDRGGAPAASPLGKAQRAGVSMGGLSPLFYRRADCRP